MRSSDTPESEIQIAPDWSQEIGSDNLMDSEVLERLQEEAENEEPDTPDGE